MGKRNMRDNSESTYIGQDSYWDNPYPKKATGEGRQIITSALAASVIVLGLQYRQETVDCVQDVAACSQDAVSPLSDVEVTFDAEAPWIRVSLNGD